MTTNWAERMAALGRHRKFERPAARAGGLDDGREIERKNMMSNMASFPGDFSPPVLKIWAQIQVWRSDDHPAGSQA